MHFHLTCDSLITKTLKGILSFSLATLILVVPDQAFCQESNIQAGELTQGFTGSPTIIKVKNLEEDSPKVITISGYGNDLRVDKSSGPILAAPFYFPTKLKKNK